MEHGSRIAIIPKLPIRAAMVTLGEDLVTTTNYKGYHEARPGSFSPKHTHSTTIPCPKLVGTLNNHFPVGGGGWWCCAGKKEIVSLFRLCRASEYNYLLRVLEYVCNYPFCAPFPYSNSLSFGLSLSLPELDTKQATKFMTHTSIHMWLPGFRIQFCS